MPIGCNGLMGVTTIIGPVKQNFGDKIVIIFLPIS